MNKHMRVYLSGGMEYATDEGRDWRSRLQQWLETELHWEVFNPNQESDKFFSQQYPSVDIRALKQTDVARYGEIVSKLVDIDCKEIATRSDLVICYWDESAVRGAGTKGELTMAKYFGKPVYLVTAVPLEEIPGWVLGCITMTFPSFDDLQKCLFTK